MRANAPTKAIAIRTVEGSGMRGGRVVVCGLTTLAGVTVVVGVVVVVPGEVEFTVGVGKKPVVPVLVSFASLGPKHG